MTYIVRHDQASLGSVEETPEGYLRGDVVATRTGVFTYQNQDGSVRRELRHPDDVFSADSLSTLSMLPVLDGHPSNGRLVDSTTNKELAVGTTGENVRPDGKYLIVPISITTQDGVQAVKNGKRQVSLGYSVQLDEEPGEYNGMPYDVRQRNIRYNHLSIVNSARAGDAASINLDSEDAIMIETGKESDENQNLKTTRSDKMTLSTTRIDGIEYQAAPEVINQLTKLDEKVKSKETALTDLQKKLDELSAERDSLKERADEFSSRDLEKETREAAKARVALMTEASKVMENANFDEMATLTDLEIKKNVVKEIFPKSVAVLDEKSEAYINARYDSALEVAETKTDMSDKRQQQYAPTHVPETQYNEDSIDVEASRDRMVKRLRNAYKHDSSKVTN